MKRIIQKIWSFKLRPEIDYKTHRKSNPFELLDDDTTPLPTAGKGTIYCQLSTPRAFNLDLIASNALIRLTINNSDVKLYCIYKGRFILLTEISSTEVALDINPAMTYWVSFDAKTRTVLYGKIVSLQPIKLMEYQLPLTDKTPSQFWMNKISHYRIDVEAKVELSSTTLAMDTI